MLERQISQTPGRIQKENPPKGSVICTTGVLESYFTILYHTVLYSTRLVHYWGICFVHPPWCLVYLEGRHPDPKAAEPHVATAANLWHPQRNGMGHNKCLLSPAVFWGPCGCMQTHVHVLSSNCVHIHICIYTYTHNVQYWHT